MTLEELLNKLIEKGWKPRGEDKIHSCRYYEEEKKFKADYTIAGIPQVLYRSIRELVSKESGLRQFVCENGMVKEVNPNEGKYPRDKMDEEEYIARNYCVNYYHSRKKDMHKTYNKNYYEYRIIESSLKDESELEDFLLNNIQIGKDE